MEGTNMRHSIVSITQAKAKLLELMRELEEEGKSFVLTKNGFAVGALVPMEDYEALTETLDILSNPSLMKRIQRSLKQAKKGPVWAISAKGRWTKKTPPSD